MYWPIHRGFSLPHLFRQFAICLTVALMAAMQLYGAFDSGHRLEHARTFPGVTYAETTAAPHAHDDHGHEHDALLADAGDGETSVAANEAGGDAPISHHHHGGGDVQMALASGGPSADVPLASILKLGVADEALPPGALRDAPYHPPRLRA